MCIANEAWSTIKQNSVERYCTILCQVSIFIVGRFRSSLLGCNKIYWFIDSCDISSSSILIIPLYSNLLITQWTIFQVLKFVRTHRLSLSSFQSLIKSNNLKEKENILVRIQSQQPYKIRVQPNMLIYTYYT